MLSLVFVLRSSWESSLLCSRAFFSPRAGERQRRLQSVSVSVRRYPVFGFNEESSLRHGGVYPQVAASGGRFGGGRAPWFVRKGFFFFSFPRASLLTRQEASFERGQLYTHTPRAAAFLFSKLETAASLTEKIETKPPLDAKKEFARRVALNLYRCVFSRRLFLSPFRLNTGNARLWPVRSFPKCRCSFASLRLQVRGVFPGRLGRQGPFGSVV